MEKAEKRITGLEVAALAILMQFLIISYLLIQAVQLNREITELKTLNKSMDTWIVRDTQEISRMRNAMEGMEKELKGCHDITEQYMRVNSTLHEDIIPAFKEGCKKVK